MTLSTHTSVQHSWILQTRTSSLASIFSVVVKVVQDKRMVHHQGRKIFSHTTIKLPQLHQMVLRLSGVLLLQVSLVLLILKDHHLHLFNLDLLHVTGPNALETCTARNLLSLKAATLTISAMVVEVLYHLVNPRLPTTACVDKINTATLLCNARCRLLQETEPQSQAFCMLKTVLHQHLARFLAWLSKCLHQCLKAKVRHQEESQIPTTHTQLCLR